MEKFHEVFALSKKSHFEFHLYSDQETFSLFQISIRRQNAD